MNRKLATAAVAALALLPAVGHAGTELVAFPTGFAGEFVPYNRVDRPDRKTVRFMYANPAAVEAARPGEPIPHGTVLVMADHKARLDGERRVTDAEGRLVPTDEVVNVFVMEKQPGWGAGYLRPRREAAPLAPRGGGGGGGGGGGRSARPRGRSCSTVRLDSADAPCSCRSSRIAPGSHTRSCSATSSRQSSAIGIR
jgi:hypothetical protein